MASSDHMASVDPWPQIRPAFHNPWFADHFSRASDAALTKSLSSGNDSISPFPSVQLDTAPILASSDPESTPNRLPNPIPAAPRGRVSKRKSRASKKSQTTFINADAANFRQMVQQVTGARLVESSAQVLKPEPQRAGDGMMPPGAAVRAGGFPPTPYSTAWRQTPGEDAGQWSAVTLVAAPAGADSGLAGVLSFDSAAGFPTLESWRVI